VAEIEEVIGRYVHLMVVGEPYRIVYEEAGAGTPLLCLHTTGLDSRHYQYMPADPELLQRYRVIAFDLPWHGRSLPPDGWWKQDYRMTTERYSLTVIAFIRGVGLRRPVVLGCSMAGLLVVELARSYLDELVGVIGLSGAAYGVGRFADWATRPEVNAAIAVTARVSGLMAPRSPLRSRKDVWWIYRPEPHGASSAEHIHPQRRLGSERPRSRDGHLPLPSSSPYRRIRLRVLRRGIPSPRRKRSRERAAP